MLGDDLRPEKRVHNQRRQFLAGKSGAGPPSITSRSFVISFASMGRVAHEPRTAEQCEIGPLAASTLRGGHLPTASLLCDPRQVRSRGSSQ